MLSWHRSHTLAQKCLPIENQDSSISRSTSSKQYAINYMTTRSGQYSYHGIILHCRETPWQSQKSSLEPIIHRTILSQAGGNMCLLQICNLFWTKTANSRKITWDQNLFNNSSLDNKSMTEIQDLVTLQTCLIIVVQWVDG